MSLEISVIICTHNPRMDYLVRVLTALKAQTLAQEHWELLLIDNASNQSRVDLVDLSWHTQSRHCSEGQLGLTRARLRGIRESVGDLLVFVDDDNVLDPDYLEQALANEAAWPSIGAYSGQVRPEFEEAPPPWTRKYWNRLAIREFAEDRWSNIPCLEHTAPNGAGLCVRRKVALEYLAYHESGKRSFVLDRTGTNLLSAGDLDLATTACDIGLGNALFTSLKLTHLMPRERLQEDYLIDLFEAQTFSAVVLDSFRSKGTAVAPLPRGLKTIVADQLRLLSKDRRERRFSRAASKGVRRASKFLASDKRTVE